MRILYVYLGGWAFVLGMCLLGIAGAGGGSDGWRPSVWAAFELIADGPGKFALAVLLLWLAYSIPFAVGVLVACGGLSSLYRKVNKRPE